MATDLTPELIGIAARAEWAAKASHWTAARDAASDAAHAEWTTAGDAACASANAAQATVQSDLIDQELRHV